MERTNLPPSTAPLPPSAASRALSIPEILLHILSNFSAPDDNEDLQLLVGCSSVARCWRGPAEMLLYQSIEVTWSYTEASKLIVAMEANPALFSLVKSLQVTGYDRHSFQNELSNKLDWNEYLKECGYKWDENNPSEAARVWEKGAGDRVAKAISMLKTHPNRFWLQGEDEGEIESGSRRVALIEFLGRLVNLRHLHLIQVDTSLDTTILRLPINVLQIFHNLDKLVVEFGEDVGIESLILAASGNLQSLELRSPCQELDLPLLSNLKHLTLEAHGVAGYDLTPLTKCDTVLETLILLPSDWMFHIQMPPDLHLPQLPHLHLTTSSIQTGQDIVPEKLLLATPKLRYLSVFSSLETTTSTSLLQRFPTLIPPEVHTIDLSLAIYQSDPLDYMELFSRVESEMLLECLRRLPESVRHLRISLPQEEHDLSELKSEAIVRGVLIEIEFEVDLEDYECSDQRERMMLNWRASRRGICED